MKRLALRLHAHAEKLLLTVISSNARSPEIVQVTPNRRSFADSRPCLCCLCGRIVQNAMWTINLPGEMAPFPV